MKKKSAEKSGRRSPVYVVYGKDEFLRARRLQSLLLELSGDDGDATAVASFDGGAASLIDILDDVRTPSMFSPLRVVCVRDADLLFARDGGDDDAAQAAPAKGAKARGSAFRTLSARELMEKYIEHPCDTGVLVLECKTWPKNTRLFKIVDKVGQNIDCEPPKDGQFEAWVGRHAREEFGCSFAVGAAARLVELVGDNSGLLHMEMSKLATYILPRTEIRTADVEAIVGESRIEIVFKLMDAITVGKPEAALRMWHQVLAGGRSAEFMAVGGLRFAFERLYNSKRMHSQGASAYDIKSALRIWDPENMLPKQLSRFSLAEAGALLRQLLRIDVNSKSGLGTVENAVEKLIVETCAAN